MAELKFLRTENGLPPPDLLSFERQRYTTRITNLEEVVRHEVEKREREEMSHRREVARFQNQVVSLRDPIAELRGLRDGVG